MQFLLDPEPEEIVQKLSTVCLPRDILDETVSSLFMNNRNGISIDHHQRPLQRYTTCVVKQDELYGLTPGKFADIKKDHIYLQYLIEEMPKGKRSND